MPVPAGPLEVVGPDAVRSESRLHAGQVVRHAHVDLGEDGLQRGSRTPHLFWGEGEEVGRGEGGEGGGRGGGTEICTQVAP